MDVRVGGQAVTGSAGSRRYAPWSLPNIVHLLAVILSSFDFLPRTGVRAACTMCVGSA